MDGVKERAKTISNRLKNASTLAASSLPNLHASSAKRARPLASGSGPDLSGIETGLALLTQAVRVQTEVAAQAVSMLFACVSQVANRLRQILSCPTGRTRPRAGRRKQILLSKQSWMPWRQPELLPRTRLRALALVLSLPLALALRLGVRVRMRMTMKEMWSRAYWP